MKTAASLKKELISVCSRVYQKGWGPGPSGNISVRIPGSNRFLLKTTGRSLGDLRSSDILTVNFEGKVIEGKGRPSKEVWFHIGIYKVRKEVNVVLHAHPPFATSYAVLGKGIPMVTEPTRRTFKRVPIVEYAPAGSEILASLVVQAFKEKTVNAILLEGHGTVTLGKDLTEAYYLTDILEDAAMVAFISSVMKKR